MKDKYLYGIIFSKMENLLTFPQFFQKNSNKVYLLYKNLLWFYTLIFQIFSYFFKSSNKIIFCFIKKLVISIFSLSYFQSIFHDKYLLVGECFLRHQINIRVRLFFYQPNPLPVRSLLLSPVCLFFLIN